MLQSQSRLAGMCRLMFGEVYTRGVTFEKVSNACCCGLCHRQSCACPDSCKCWASPQHSERCYGLKVVYCGLIRSIMPKTWVSLIAYRLPRNGGSHRHVQLLNFVSGLPGVLHTGIPGEGGWAITACSSSDQNGS